MGKGNFRPPAASKPKTTPPVISFTPTINRLLHGGFIALGISLAFDPFDPNVPWKQRPLLAKLWLLAILATTAALLGWGIGRNDAA
jgi:hypothetical protein